MNWEMTNPVHTDSDLAYIYTEKVKKNLAMTGEITLRGNVLPIGGLKEKIIAAHRGGVKRVIVPQENAKDLQEVPKNIMKEMTVIEVTHMDQVLRHAIEADRIFVNDQPDNLPPIHSEPAVLVGGPTTNPV